MRQVFPHAVPDVQVSKYPAPAQAGRQRTSAGLFIPLNFRSSSIRFLGESHLPRELVPITGFLRFLDPGSVLLVPQ